MLYPPSSLDGNQVLQHAFDEATQRLRVDASISISSGIAVAISHLDDSIRLGDGTNFLTSTTIGGDIALDVYLSGGAAIPTSLGQKTSANSFPVVLSSDQPAINVNVVSTGASDYASVYSEANAVASGVETTVATYTAPMGTTPYLLLASASGTSIADFKLKVNGTNIARKYTYFSGDLSAEFDFRSSDIDSLGYELAPGDVVTVTVIHDRSLSNFNATINVIEK